MSDFSHPIGNPNRSPKGSPKWLLPVIFVAIVAVVGFGLNAAFPDMFRSPPAHTTAK